MKKTFANPKASIPLNAIDRSYLIPEGNDAPWFPMCITATAQLRQPLNAAQVIDALHHVEQRFPQLRLGYTLDLERLRWQRAADVKTHLASIVHRSDTSDLESALAQLMQVNNTPVSHPITIHIHDRNLIVKMHHSFGDGKFLLQLLAYLLLALADPAQLKALPDLPDHYHIPLRRLVGRHLAQVGRGWWQSIAQYHADYQHDTQAHDSSRESITSGSPMGVTRHIIPATVMAALDEIRAQLDHISLNTLLQVLIAKRLRQLQLIDPTVTYTIPVDLHRYLPQPDTFYPGNLASQIRLRGQIDSDLPTACEQLQQQISQQLEAASPLVDIPNFWLLGLGGRKTYERVNRDWLLSAIHNDPRFFVLTNLGNLDSLFAPLLDTIAPEAGVYLSVPLMGGPHLVLSFNTYAGQGNLAITYDPQVLSAKQIADIRQMFDLEWLHQEVNHVLAD